ncbi:MAG: hypothetical protein JXO44_14010 [Clostridia bacterium]|nr:hypothetical protein [Clostridia bacterium]
MLKALSSDVLFVTFIISLIITVLLITSGVGMAIPEQYNVRYRAHMRDDTHNDTTKMSYKRRGVFATKSSVWSIVFTLSVLMTLVTFILFLIVTFVMA